MEDALVEAGHGEVLKLQLLPGPQQAGVHALQHLSAAAAAGDFLASSQATSVLHVNLVQLQMNQFEDSR